jgi:hypothetical protein
MTAGAHRKLKYCGMRIMQAAAMMSSRARDANGGLTIMSITANRNAQGFYGSMRPFGLKPTDRGGEVKWSLEGRDNERFIAGIESHIEKSVTSAGQDKAGFRIADHETRKEAYKIHAENLKVTSAIQDKTLICHVVTDSILPDMQLKEGVLNRLETKMRSPKFGEKIVALSVKNPDNAEEYMAKLEALKAQIESEYQGYKVQFDVACPRPEYVESIQKLGMQALAFKRDGEGEIIQIEGIILALRALRTGSIASLISAYKTITGKDYTTDKADINELAKIMLFILPVRKIDVDKIGTINKLIEENIKAAA